MTTGLPGASSCPTNADASGTLDVLVGTLCACVAKLREYSLVQALMDSRGSSERSAGQVDGRVNILIRKRRSKLSSYPHSNYIPEPLFTVRFKLERKKSSRVSQQYSK